MGRGFYTDSRPRTTSVLRAAIKVKFNHDSVENDLHHLTRTSVRLHKLAESLGRPALLMPRT
jgi:hypothetical protein